MNKRKIILSVMVWADRERLRSGVHLLLSLCLIAVIFMSYETDAYALDSTSGADIHKRSLIVKNWKGEYIGTSHHVVMDPSTANIVFIIVSLDQGEYKEIAVPAGLFFIDKEHGSLILNISKKQLGSSPAYHDSDLQDPEFINKVYRYFGITPPWTEETPKRENEAPQRF